MPEQTGRADADAANRKPETHREMTPREILLEDEKRFAEAKEYCLKHGLELGGPSYWHWVRYGLPKEDEPGAPSASPSHDKLRERAEPVSRSCAICGAVAHDGKPLCDGRSYHQACYIDLHKQFEHWSSVRTRLFLARDEHARIMARTRSFRYRIGLLFGGELIDVARHEMEVSRLDVQLRETREELARSEQRLRDLWDFWPGYPPDWDRRQDDATREAGCAACGRRSGLHVHHLQPISRGGNHRPENLVVLCAEHHGAEHGRDFTRRKFVPDDGPSSYGQRIEILQAAIASGHDVHFRYQKYNGETTSRTFTPRTLKQVGQTLCVDGLCHLRHEERSFAIKRMRRVRPIAPPN